MPDSGAGSGWWSLGVPVAALAVWGLVDNAKLFVTTALNGLTLAALYFLVASGFTLVFGLMRNVNLAHGSLYLLGAYVGYMVGDKTGSWLLAVAAGFASAALFGLVLQVTVFRFMQGQDLRQTLVTIALSIMLADVLLWIFGGEIYQFDPPRWIFGRTPLPLVQVYPTYRLVLLAISAAIGVLLWLFLNRTRVGMMIRAGWTTAPCSPPPASTCRRCSRSPSRSAPGWPASPGWSAAPRSRSLPARTPAISSPRWWW